MSLPSVDDVRERISKVAEDDIRYCLMTCYLYAGRISEVVSKVAPTDNTVPRGPRGTDVRLDEIEGVEAALFSVYTAKRDGMERIVALPFKYELWAEELYNYFANKKDEKVFQFTRQKAWLYAREAFAGFNYQIEKYKVVEKTGGGLKIVKEQPRHMRTFALHALRHLRATELVRFYHFKAEDLAAYCGWRLRTVAKDISPVMERYIDLAWQSYFPKLLKRRKDLANS